MVRITASVLSQPKGGGPVCGTVFLLGPPALSSVGAEKWRRDVSKELAGFWSPLLWHLPNRVQHRKGEIIGASMPLVALNHCTALADGA